MPRIASDADAFRAISDPTRRRILTLLAGGERSVSEIANPFDVSLPAISQHLAVLRSSGLVTERKEGRRRLYAVQAEAMREVAEFVAHFEKFWSEKLDALGRHLDEEEEK